MEIMQQGPMEAPGTTSYKALGGILQKANSMYGGMGMSDYFTAFSAAGGLSFLNNWPQIQNTRVKGINTRPADFSKDQISTMVQNPDGSEKSLRAVSASLAYSTKTYDLILKTYPDTLTYSWYVYPTYTDAEISKKEHQPAGWCSFLSGGFNSDIFVLEALHRNGFEFSIEFRMRLF